MQITVCIQNNNLIQKRTQCQLVVQRAQTCTRTRRGSLATVHFSVQHPLRFFNCTAISTVVLELYISCTLTRRGSLETGTFKLKELYNGFGTLQSVLRFCLYSMYYGFVTLQHVQRFCNSTACTTVLSLQHVLRFRNFTAFISKK